LARALVLVFGALAYLIALQAEGVYALVKDASAFGSSGIFVIVVLGLFTRKGHAASAFAALAVGLLIWVAGSFVWPFSGVYVGSLLAYTALLGVGARAQA
jgi:Na+/proline symporter